MSEQTVVWCVDSRDTAFQSEHRATRGVHLSPSFVSEMLCDASENQGLFQASYRNLEQETVWERIRRRHYPRVTSRLGAIFAYPDWETAEQANECHWLGGRDLYTAEVFPGSQVLLADGHWLDCAPEDYEVHAHRYFQGVMSERPSVEMLVHGGIRAEMEPVAAQPLAIDTLLASRHQQQTASPILRR